jgi:hypothetical protein
MLDSNKGRTIRAVALSVLSVGFILVARRGMYWRCGHSPRWLARAKLKPRGALKGRRFRPIAT